MSENFALEEFLHSDTADAMGINNYPTWGEVDCLTSLAEVMEDVRVLLGNKPITINSGFRCASVNSAVGGVSDSAHLYGLACDFVCPSFGSPLDICRALEAHLETLGIDQLIHEMDAWVHLGLAADGTPRHQCLTINNRGTYNGFV